MSPEVEAPPSCTTEEESWEEGRLIYPNAVGTTERGVSSPANPDRVVWVPMSMTIAETSSAFCVLYFFGGSAVVSDGSRGCNEVDGDVISH